MADAAWKSVASNKRRRTAKQKRSNPAPRKTINYFDYLKSKAWRKKRLEALRYHGKKCSVCGSTRALQVHHKHYKTVGREAMKDLAVLCESCHRNEHERHGVMDPMTREFFELFN